MLAEHLPGCRTVYPREILKLGEDLPEGIDEDLGVQVCVEGCPRLEELRQWALTRMSTRGPT